MSQTLRNLFFTFIATFLFLPLFAQVDSLDVNHSPYTVIYNHLHYLQSETYEVDKAALSFPLDTDDAEQLAIQLKKVLDGRGMYLDLNQLPVQPGYLDSASNQQIYFLSQHEPRIYVEKIGEKWYYSRTTIGQIPELFEEVYPLGTDFAQSFHGPFWDFAVFGIAMSKWLGLLVLILGSILVFYIASWIINKVLSAFIGKRFGFSEALLPILRKASRLLSLLLSTRLLLFFLPMFQLPVRLHALLIQGLGIISIIFLILLIIQISGIAFHYFGQIAAKTKNTLDDQLLPVLRRIVSIIIWAFGVIYILDFLDVNVTALLAGISIGGLAIALAAQDTVKNFFGSIMIFLDRPFQIGDWVSFDGVEGVVEEVGVRSTRIRSFANSVVYVPNGLLADKVVDNMGLRTYRRYTTQLGLTYNTPPEKIDLFVKGMKEIILRHPKTRKDYFEVHLNGFAASSLNVLLYCFFKTSTWSEELEARHEIIYAALLLASDLGVSFAFPSQSLYLETGLPANGAPQMGADPMTKQDLDSSLDRISTYFGK